MHQVEQRLKRQFDATTNTIATAQTAQGDTTDAALRAHVQAHAHTQEAVEATQHVVEGFAERLHLLETARGLTSGSLTTPTNGRWREQDPVVVAVWKANQTGRTQLCLWYFMGIHIHIHILVRICIYIYIYIYIYMFS